ncbi:MAG: hypothetical protein ABSH53_05985 [Holophaga sp.]|jgi:hypothetical protein
MEDTRLNHLGCWARFLPAALVALAPAGAAPTRRKAVDLGESAERYAELSVLEGGGDHQ